MKNVGLHIRLEDTITNVAEKALRLNLKFFQTFITLPEGKYLKLSEEDVRNFLELRKNFDELYLHGSYWINLCSAYGRSLQILKRELTLAKKLQFTYLVLHPGAATGFENREEGIHKLANNLNIILKSENDVQIILENTTHGKKSIGGNLLDYQLLINLLEQPKKIKFCIDSSHAYAYGYDITTEDGLNKFDILISETIGKENIKLIHLNDTNENLGSKIDKHEIPGQGNIGFSALNKFVEKIGDHLPILLELPPATEQEEKEVLMQIQNW